MEKRFEIKKSPVNYAKSVMIFNCRKRSTNVTECYQK